MFSQFRSQPRRADEDKDKCQTFVQGSGTSADCAAKFDEANDQGEKRQNVLFPGLFIHCFGKIREFIKTIG